MNDVELFTKNITIMVHLGEYDYDNPEDFDVTIEAGNNETKVITVTLHTIKRQSYKDTYRIYYQALSYFTLDELKITCKYPVVLSCDDVVLCKYIEPIKN